MDEQLNQPRHDKLRLKQRLRKRVAVATACVLLVPHPWKYDTSVTYGFVDNLDTLEVNGDEVSLPGDGQLSRVGAIGRPQLVGEVILKSFLDEPNNSLDVRRGTETSKPAVGVPAAVRVGLEHAGHPVDELEASTSYNLVPGGILVEPIAGPVTSLVKTVDDIVNLDELYTGDSDGLMVALTAYSDAAGVDLAQGRHIVGTGGIKEDGTVTTIGSLPTKAIAANRANADVLLVPASQIDKISGLSLPGTEIVPVETLQGAINWLSAPVGENQ
jgi:hypothetical protein